MANKDQGVIRAIVIAVVIALIAGGSAPWWWARLFPTTTEHPSINSGAVNSGANENSATPRRAKGVGACASGDSPSNEFHDEPASNGSWDWNCNGRVEREWSPCENLTREQCDPSTNKTGAPPGFCTELRAAAGCPEKIGECGKQGWIYPCFYNASDGRCHAGGYETAQIMRCK
jgi:hypothetical protein